MVRKRLTAVEKLERKLRRAKGRKSLPLSFVTSEQFAERLTKRRQMTLKRILESPGASQSSKKRARKILGI